jgi:NitT/TauT family transport system permease protein
MMTLRLPFPAPAAIGGRRIRYWSADLVVVVGVLALLAAFAALSAGMTVPFGPGQEPTVSTDPANLPYYAGRSLVRMFAALGLSTVFAIGYGYAAAKSRRAERVLIPLLDVLQSVPVLGFLSVTVTAFIALFPGSLLGLECAAIFAIFTSQAWNMAFSAYASFSTLPRDLTEVTRIYRLSPWQRLRRLELPAATVGLIWNGMMSMGGGWFFLVASEAITVNDQSYTLPGVGSYVSVAIAEQNLPAIGWAILTMVIVVVAVDRLFWRPLVAWSERFKLEESEASERVESAVLDLLRRSRLVALAGRSIAVATRRLARLVGHLALGVRRALPRGRSDADTGRGAGATGWLSTVIRSDRAFNFGLTIVLIIGGISLGRFVASGVTAADLVTVLIDGLLTFARVIVVVAASVLVWTPIGVWIGMNPRVSRVAQPIVQVAASFPANFLFPFFTIAMLATGFPIDIGSIVLMALGAQWYILFNAIAGAMAIPNDLREAAAILRLSRRLRWRALILPAIFPHLVTGGITAAGGAWNASIVAEIVSWGPVTLEARGLGADIARATSVGDFPLTFLGISVMVLFVVGLNRLFWRRLYVLAETRYRLA